MNFANMTPELRRFLWDVIHVAQFAYLEWRDNKRLCVIELYVEDGVLRAQARVAKKGKK